MTNREKSKDNNLYSFLACLTFIVFFSRVGEIYPILATIRINFLSFSLTFMLFLYTGVYKTIEWSRNGATKLIALYLLIGVIIVPFAVWPTNAFDSWREYMLINSLICYFCLAAIQNEKQLVRLVYAFLIGTFLLISALFINPITTAGGRAFVAYSYDPNDLAMIFAVTFPLVVGQFFVAGKKGRLFLGAYMIMLISGIIKTGSRGGLLALSVATLLILFSSVVKVKIWHKALLVMVIVIFLLSSAAENVLDRWSDVISGKDYNVADTEEGVGGRIAIWKAGLKLFGENLFFGVGVGNSSTAMGARFGQYGWLTMHNTYLQAALELGIGGIIVLFLMLRSIWCNCTQVIKEHAKQSLNKRIFILAYFLRISLVVFIIASFFLSQAYSIIISFLLVIANRLNHFGQKGLK